MHTLLVVDDNAQNIDVFRALLGKDFKLKAATSGEKALKICLTDSDIDLILLDIIMPEVDGFSVCRALKSNARTKSIPVVFVTSLNDEASEKRGFEVGASDYITKPVSALQLRSRIASNIRLKELSRNAQSSSQEQTQKTLDTIANYLITSSDENVRNRFSIVESMRGVLSNYDVDGSVDYQMSAMLAALLDEPELAKTDSQFHNSEDIRGIGAELLKTMPGTELASSIVERWGDELPEANFVNQYEQDPEMLGRLLLKAASMMSRDNLRATSDPITELIAKYAPLLSRSEDTGKVSYPMKVDDLMAGMTLAEPIMSAKGCIFIPSGTKLTVPIVNYLTNVRKNNHSIADWVNISGLDFSEEV